MYSEKLNRNGKTKKLPTILVRHELMLTYGYITYICLFKALVINKPVLQHHKSSASSLNFFLDIPRIYDNDRTIVVQVMMNLKVNSDCVFEEIRVRKLKYHTHVLYVDIFLHFSYKIK